MSGVGPPPKLHGRRSNRKPAFWRENTLPASGRQGPPPAWPIADGLRTGVTARQRKVERALWKQVWAYPQAVIWESWALTDQVCFYVILRARSLVSPSVALQAECRLEEDRLGLSPASMARLGWVIRDDAGTDVTPTTGEGKILNMRVIKAE